MKNTIQTFVFDRSDPLAVVAYGPDEHSGEMRDFTEIEELRRGFFPRTDMAMVNFWGANGDCLRQECVYFTETGIEWNGLAGYFTQSEHDQLERIRLRLLGVVGMYPEMWVYLGRADRYYKAIATWEAVDEVYRLFHQE